jgi:glycosyl transferase family 25
MAGPNRLSGELSVFAAYQRIRIINLASRRDRRRQMRRELSRVGLAGDRRVAFFEAVKPDAAAPWRSIGERGCFESHLAILKEAAEAGESVMILEDDADFTAAAGLRRPEVDVLWGGGTYHSDEHIEGTHCIGFSAQAAKRLVPFLEGLKGHPSPPPIDGAYVWFRRANPDIRVHLCAPQIAVQRPSVSDIAGARGLDRYSVARPALAVLRRIKREWRRRRLNGRSRPRRSASSPT